MHIERWLITVQLCMCVGRHIEILGEELDGGENIENEETKYRNHEKLR